ncbi:MAG: cysteine hydrolase [Acidimicrobiia bacterium]|nr:cysteine hydrolase [Acidimicrobiia bacterium]
MSTIETDVSAPDLRRAALITIDTQQDTLDGQPLEIAGTSAALPNIIRLCQAFRDAHRPIVHIVRLYRPDGTNAEPIRRELVRGRTPVLRPGTPGRSLAPGLITPKAAELDDDLLLAGGIQQLGEDEFVIYKPRWGAFFCTPLEDHLRSLGAIDSLVFVGCNFPNCPRASIYEASERDYRIALVEDAVSGLYGRGRNEMLNIGVEVLTTAELLRAMSSTVTETTQSRGTA